jgi:hypothetical protein
MYVLSTDDLDSYLENLPPILKYNNVENNKKINKFEGFEGLPLELQEKIFRLQPKQSTSLSKKYHVDTTFRSNYYDNYCLKTAITEHELTHYFNSVGVGKTIDFSYFLIGHNDDDDNILVQTEDYQIVKLVNNKYLVLNRNKEGTYYNASSTKELVFDIFGTHNIDKTYLFMPSPSLLKEILRQRLGCNIDDYVEKYLYIMVNEFLNFFVSMPLVISDFVDNYLKISINVDNNLIDDLESVGEGNFVMVTDDNLIQTSKQINETILSTYFEYYAQMKTILNA